MLGNILCLKFSLATLEVCLYPQQSTATRGLFQQQWIQEEMLFSQPVNHDLFQSFVSRKLNSAIYKL